MNSNSFKIQQDLSKSYNFGNSFVSPKSNAVFSKSFSSSQKNTIIQPLKNYFRVQVDLLLIKFCENKIIFSFFKSQEAFQI